MQLGNSHELLHMLNSSCKAVSSAVAPHIHWITRCSSTSMHRPLSLGLGTTGTVDRKGPRWQPCNKSMGHGSHASKGILTAELTSPVPSSDHCFSACRWYIYWTSDYFLILFKLCSVSHLKYNITSAVHMMTRSLKEHTGFSEIPGRLGKAHLLGNILQLSESPVIFLSFITPETCPVAITLDSTQISLNPAPWNLPRMENDLQLDWGL